jgi:hypothetical protein
MPLSHSFFPIVNPTAEIPECERIGILASRRGNFSLARQMFKLVIRQMEGEGERQGELIKLTMDIAETYEREGSFRPAKDWYNKAFLLWERLPERDYLHGACIMAKLSLLSVLDKDLNSFQSNFDRLERAYLLSTEERVAPLLSILIDLSWALCLHGHTHESHLVNGLINQIQTEESLDVEPKQEQLPKTL